MKKFLITICLLTALSLVFSIGALADAGQVSEEIAKTEDESENTFSELYALFTEHCDKIFASLAFISSLALALAYKRGLIPTLNAGLSAIKKGREDTDRASLDSLKETEASVSLLTDKFAEALNTLTNLSDRMDELCQRQMTLEMRERAADDLRTVMLSQTDMLSEILMNSSLPQYSKDRIAERVSEMRKSIKVGEENGAQ